MCGFTYDDRYFRRPSSNSYEVQVRLDKYYSYQKNSKKDETEEEYFKRVTRKKK